MQELAAYIRQRQRELGLGQNELARLCGMSQGTLANLLAGRVTKAPSLSTIERLARGLRVDLSQLLSLVLGTDAEGPAAGPVTPGAAATPPRETAPSAPSALTDAERSILQRAQANGIYWHCEVDPDILSLSPERRFHLFQLLDSFVHFVNVSRGKPT